jgi:hypothetical protein
MFLFGFCILKSGTNARNPSLANNQGLNGKLAQFTKG